MNSAIHNPDINKYLCSEYRGWLKKDKVTFDLGGFLMDNECYEYDMVILHQINDAKWSVSMTEELNNPDSKYQVYYTHIPTAGFTIPNVYEDCCTMVYIMDKLLEESFRNGT